MLHVGKERVEDIYALNQLFLELVAGSVSGDEFGVDREVLEVIKGLPPEALKQVAETDVLLFSTEDVHNNIPSNGKSVEITTLIERLNLVVRDFAQQDLGLAVSYLGVTMSKGKEMLKMGTQQIREHAKTVSCTIKMIPLGGLSFRVLTGFTNAAERTRYATLAANDAY